MPAITDNFRSSATGLMAPIVKAFAITPTDDTMLSELPRELYIGTGGTLVVKYLSGNTLDTLGSAITYTNVPNGFRLPDRVASVQATGTTCSGIVGRV